MPEKLPESQSRIERRYPELPDELEAEFSTSLDALASYHYGKDYDRLLYSSSFRKLGGVTQVVTSAEVAVFHNRLTHSLKVAQTAGLITGTIQRKAQSNRNLRSTIAKYGGLHPTVVRAACLAHDIGHPPFGHIGETALQDLLDTPSRFITEYPESAGFRDSFEGNAQSFRIVSRLAFREAPPSGSLNPALNLTRATLAAVCKYPWNVDDDRRKKSNKWCAYYSESDLLAWCMEGIPSRTVDVNGRQVDEARSIEAQIMDWADDIAYAIHDVEDFFRAGLVPLHILAEGGNEFDSFVKYAYARTEAKLPAGYNENSVKDLLEQRVAGELPTRPYQGSMEERAVLHGFASSVIRTATRKIELSDAGVLYADPETVVIVEMLKKLTEYYVIDRPILGSSQRGQQKILVEVVSELWAWAYEDAKVPAPGERTGRRGELILPPRLTDYITIASAEEMNRPDATLPAMILRGVVDYVGSMTDAQTLALHGRLTGRSSGSMLDPWLFL